MIDYSDYISDETSDIKKLVNEILNHPLLNGENRKWIAHNDREFFCPDGGCIDFYEDGIESSVKGVTYIIKLLQEYKPKRILEVGMNAGSFSIIAKLTLGDVRVFTVEKIEEFTERASQINNFFGEKLITLYSGWSDTQEFRNWTNNFTPYDFAWIDGNHTEETSTFDIETAIINKVPIIGCDDCGPKIPTGVWDSVNKLSNKGLIEIVGESKIESTVGAITVVKNLRK